MLGTTITVDVGNSYGQPTIGVLLVGTQQADIPTRKGGHLLLIADGAILLSLAPSGTSVDGDIPSDESLCGAHVYAQALELDPGAAKGVSFTPGLDLLLGH